MPGTLYVVTTPLGNLGDLTPRAAQTFAQVDFIAAEDTRVTLKLLNHLGLKKPMVSYHEHNAREREEAILARLAAGENCALCSDAGVPTLSDPGEALVRAALEQDIPVTPIPGASAAITALCVSGQATGRFVFEGFLAQNRRQRAQRLAALQNEERTIILYEAPHKLPTTLNDLLAAFGPQRSVTLCRELTKLHEEIWKTTLAAAAQKYQATTPRGEFVLVLAGAPTLGAPGPSLPLAEAAQQALRLAREQRLSASEAARRVSAETGHPKNALYKEMQKHLQK